jgi:hypothetical protein
MMKRTRRTVAARGAILFLVLAPLGLTGCTPFSPGFYPFSMGLFTPIPVPAWVSTRIEDKLGNKNDYRTAILPPIQPGLPLPACEDPPDEAQILRAIKQVPRGVPYIYEEFRDDIQFSVERLVDRIDPPRFYPLVGWAQLHHCHYKCTVFFTETKQSGYPFPYYIRKPRLEVVYIDKDHLHLVPNGSPAANQEVTRELGG